MLTCTVRKMLACVFLFATTQAIAQISVPATATFNLNGGSIDLGTSSLQIAGTFALGSGIVQNVANVAISPGGLLNAGSGAITLFGDWSDLGSFSGGSSHVNFIDGGASPATISGTTGFANLSLISSTHKAYAFQGGTTQSISGLLTILGTAAAAIQVQSTTASPVALINLLPGGSQNIDFVGVSHVHAIGQPLAPTKTNDGGAGDATGWFGSVVAAISVLAAPLLSPLNLLLLALGIFGIAFNSMRRSPILNLRNIRV